MKKIVLSTIVCVVILSACSNITPGEIYEGEITFSDDSNYSTITGYTYYYDTYHIRGEEGDEYFVELWADEDAPVNLEWVGGGYQRDICSTSGDSYDSGYFTLEDGRNTINVYLIEWAVTEAGVGYSFQFTKQ